MAACGSSMILGVSAGVAIGALTLAASAPASAQSIFERLLGGFHRSNEAPAGLPADIRAFADPFAGARGAPPRQTETGPASAFCVRTSDGFYFPVRAQAGVSAATACHAFCPASATRLYFGSGIDHAVASDGSRYADLDTAFLYRQRLVAGSTCNGRDPFGLAPVDVITDPTLRPGDVVATNTGLVAFTGTKNKLAEFTPVQSDRKLPQSTRAKLSGVKIMPPNPGASPVTLTGHARGEDRRSAQLSR